MKVYIKNMVCPRCITSVEQILKRNNLEAIYVRLGEAALLKKPTERQLSAFSQELLDTGFELLDDQRSQLIEQVKTILIQKIQSGNVEEHFSLTRFIGKKVFKDYSSVSKLFSELEGITLEQFFNLQKIEKVKELLIYKEQTLTQIAFDLGYSSTQHLSSQFKKLTGMTPSQFKQIGTLHRKSIDNIRKEQD